MPADDWVGSELYSESLPSSMSMMTLNSEYGVDLVSERYVEPGGDVMLDGLEGAPPVALPPLYLADGEFDAGRPARHLVAGEPEQVVPQFDALAHRFDQHDLGITGIREPVIHDPDAQVLGRSRNPLGPRFRAPRLIGHHMPPI